MLAFIGLASLFKSNQSISIFLRIILILIILQTACKKNSIKKEKELLCDTFWVNVFAEIHLTESAADSEVPKVRDSLTQVFAEQVFRKNGVKKSQYDSVYKKIVANPDTFLDFYKCVGQKLDKVASKN